MHNSTRAESLRHDGLSTTTTRMHEDKVTASGENRSTHERGQSDARKHREWAKGRKGERAKGQKGERAKGRKGERAKVGQKASPYVHLRLASGTQTRRNARHQGHK
jgi:hypothetical protein